MKQTIEQMKMELMRLEAQRFPRGMEQERASNMNRVQTLQRLIGQETAQRRPAVDVIDTEPTMPGPMKSHIRPKTENWKEMDPEKYKARFTTETPVTVDIDLKSKNQ